MLSRQPLVALVIKVHLDLLVRKVMLAETEMMELPVNRARMERTQSFCPQRSLSHASSARLDLQVLTDKWDPKDHPARRDLLASHQETVFPGSKEWLASLDRWADPEGKDRVAHLETQDVLSQCPVLRVHKDRLAHQERLDLKANPALTVNRSKGHPASRESPVCPAKKDALDPQAKLDHLATTERRALATTAPNHVHHPAIKTNDRSGFQKENCYANGLVSIITITIILVSILQPIESRKIFVTFDAFYNTFKRVSYRPLVFNQ